jgi:uroporphyrinogen decarboxylase
MDHIERFFATIERKPVDRPASWLGLPDPAAIPGLLKHFKASDLDELRQKIDDDLYPVELPYHSPCSDAIYAAFEFAKKDKVKADGRSLTVPGYFEDVTDPAKVDDFDWPDPTKYIDPDECRTVVENVPSGYPVLGVVWSAHFQDVWAAFGMETALVKMLQEPEVFQAVLDRIVDFYLTANEIFYKATKGRLHAVLIGNDFGSQTGLMLSPEQIRKFALPGTRKIVEQAKNYGIKVIHHSCGSIYDLIPDLIDCNVDAIHPIQALAKNMDARKLKDEFGDKVSFVGGVDAQYLLVKGTPMAIRQRVHELKDIFPTGLVISPSHEAILPDVDPANIQALFSAVKNGSI